MKKVSFIMILALMILSSCKTENSKKIVEEASLRFDWFTSMTFSGEVWAHKEFAKKHGLNLKIESGSETTDPIKLVLSGANDFGCVSVDKFLIANEKGADLVAIGVINQLSPTVFLSKKDKNILTPQEWKGKKVGVLPGGATTYVYESLKMKEGLSSKDYEETIIPFDLVTFIADKYDVRPAFIYDEPLYLESKGIEYNLIEPKNFGINYVGRVYFAKREFVEKNDKIVQKFVNALADGWNNSIKNPSKAIEILKEFEPKTNVKRDLAALNRGIPYFVDADGNCLTFNYKYWDETVNELIKLKILKKTDYKYSINDSFINKYYNK